MHLRARETLCIARACALAISSDRTSLCCVLHGFHVAMNSVHNNTASSSLTRRNLPLRCSRISHSRPIALKTVPRTVFKAIFSGNTLTESAALATMNPATGQLNPTGTTQALAYTYDAKNRLSRAQIGANTADTVSYKINAMGQRVQKTGAGAYAFNSSLTIDAATGLSPLARTINFNARYVYDEQGRLIGEYAPDGKLISETVWFNDLPIATLRPKGANAGTPLGQAGTTTGNPSNGATAANANNVGNNSTTNRVNVEVFYVHADHLGTPRTVTRSTIATGANAPSSSTPTSPGAINKAVWRWDSDPFGTSLDNSKPIENPQIITGTATVVQAASIRVNSRFDGQLVDAETGAHYNYSRNYAATMGRYLTSDPTGLFGGLSTFAYVENDPVSWSDPFGEKKGRLPRHRKPPKPEKPRQPPKDHLPPLPPAPGLPKTPVSEWLPDPRWDKCGLIFSCPIDPPTAPGLPVCWEECPPRDRCAPPTPQGIPKINGCYEVCARVVFK